MKKEEHKPQHVAIAEWCNGFPYGHKKYCFETLYKTESGDYSLLCEYYKGFNSIIMTEAEAKDWGQRNLKSDVYEEIFGGVFSRLDGGVQTLHVGDK